MPNQTKSKRIPISLKPELYSVISDLSEIQNKPMSRLVTEMLDELLPVLTSVRDGLQELQKTNDPKAILKRIGSDLLIDGTQQLGVLSKEIKDL